MKFPFKIIKTSIDQGYYDIHIYFLMTFTCFPMIFAWGFSHQVAIAGCHDADAGGATWTYKKLLKMAIYSEFSLEKFLKMLIFHSYVNVYQRVNQQDPGFDQHCESWLVSSWDLGQIEKNTASPSRNGRNSCNIFVYIRLYKNINRNHLMIMLSLFYLFIYIIM